VGLANASLLLLLKCRVSCFSKPLTLKPKVYFACDANHQHSMQVLFACSRWYSVQFAYFSSPFFLHSFVRKVATLPKWQQKNY